MTGEAQWSELWRHPTSHRVLYVGSYSGGADLILDQDCGTVSYPLAYCPQFGGRYLVSWTPWKEVGRDLG